MNYYKLDLLWHSWKIHACLPGFRAEASLDLSNFTLEIRARNRYYRFYPRFLARGELGGGYVHLPNDKVVGFIGWLPYINKRWPIGSGKFAFKDFCAASNLATPRMWRAPSPEMRDFVVKHDQSSFGSGLNGPFREYDAKDQRQILQKDGYYEQFIRGRMLKAWYWEDRLVALDFYDMPTVTGDGKSTLRALVERAGRRGTATNWDAVGGTLRYQGMTLDTVLQQGQEALADFRYGSNLVPAVFDSSVTLERFGSAPFVEQLKQCGPVLWNGIPEESRLATLYTLDGIVDAEEKVWLLEMNCNPAVHPDVYSFMFDRLFGPRETTTAPAMQPASPHAAPPFQSFAGAPSPWIPFGARPGAPIPAPKGSEPH